MRASSTWAVGGARAGAATNSYMPVSHCSERSFLGGFSLNGQSFHVQGKSYQSRVANKLASQPEEGLLKVVVGLGRDIVVLEVLLAVEGNSLCLDLALLHVDLVTAKYDGNVLANTDQVTCALLEPILHPTFRVLVSFSPLLSVIRLMGDRRTVPVGNVLVGDTAGDVEHDNTALAVDVVSITETTKLLLASSVPNIELDLTKVLQRGVSVVVEGISDGGSLGGGHSRW